MADRPQAPEPGTPEYEWLYGGSGGADDDATQVIPTGGSPNRGRAPRGQQGPAADPHRPEPTRVIPAEQPRVAPRRPHSPPPGAPPHHGGPGRARRRIRPFRWVFLLLVLWLAFLVAVPFFAFSKASTVTAFPGGERPADQGGTTYLVVGSDSRADLSEEERRKFGTGGDVGQRTDTMMILHIGSGPNLLMSIPRDSLVDIPGRGTSKINASYAHGGPELLVETIEQNTGIRIDHYIEIGFGGFVNMVDAVGGIEICPEKAMRDEDAHLDIAAGCQQADGVTALGFARSRKSDQQYGDISRAKNQRAVVAAIGDKVVSPWTVINPFRYWDVNMAAASTVKVSEGTGPVALGRFAWAMTRTTGSNGLTCGVPIADLAVNWDRDRSREMFKHIINDDTEGIPRGLCTPTGLEEQ